MTFHTNWLNCCRNWFSEIHRAAEEQPLTQLTVQEFSGLYKQSLWGLSMSWEYFWHSDYNALNTSDNLSASIEIFKQCRFNTCIFSFFPQPNHTREKEAYLWQSRWCPFSQGMCWERRVECSPTNSAVTVACQARAQLQFSGSICTSKSRIIVCIMVIHIGPKSWLRYLLGKTVVLILETYSALWLPVKNKTFAWSWNWAKPVS